MKFKAKVRDFIDGLEPAIIVATKGVVKNWELANIITIIAENKRILVRADGGRMNIENEISEHTCQNDLSYECEEEGACSVKASDIKATLLSFDPDEEVWVEERKFTEDRDDSGDEDDSTSAFQDSGKEIVFTQVSDSEQFQTMPCYRRFADKPQYVVDFMETQKDNDALKISKDIFVTATNRVFFAKGFEDHREKYQYWMIRARPGSVRFVAGSGGIFAALDLEGDNIIKGNNNFDLLVPIVQTGAILDIMSKVSDENICFYRSDRHLVIKGSYFLASISNYEAGLKWVDENKFLDRNSPCKLTTKIADWSNVVRGMSATFSQDMKKEHDYHYATLTVDFDKKVILAKTEGQLRSNRKIPIADLQLNGLESDGKMVISCVSKYFAEAVKNSGNDEHVQIELETPKNALIFRYHAKDTVDDAGSLSTEQGTSGISERYAVFFAPKKNS